MSCVASVARATRSSEAFETKQEGSLRLLWCWSCAVCLYSFLLLLFFLFVNDPCRTPSPAHLFVTAGSTHSCPREVTLNKHQRENGQQHVFIASSVIPEAPNACVAHSFTVQVQESFSRLFPLLLLLFLFLFLLCGSTRSQGDASRSSPPGPDFCFSWRRGEAGVVQGGQEGSRATRVLGSLASARNLPWKSRVGSVETSTVSAVRSFEVVV